MSPPPAPPPALTGGRLFRYGLGLVLLTVLLRLPLLASRSAIDDERTYSVVAHEMLDGGLPYRDAVERKPPLLFWTYAAIFRVAGRYNWTGLHVAAVLWILLTLAGLYGLGTRLIDRRAGLAAALLYAVYQAWWPGKTLALNGEVLMNLPLVWGALLVLRPSASRTRPELLLAGALLCAGFLLKQPAAIAAVAFGISLLLPAYRRGRGISAVQSVLHAALLTAGFFATLGAVILIVRSQGIFSDALYWTIRDHADPYFAWLKAIGLSLAFSAVCAPLVWGAWRALRELRRSPPDGIWRDRRPELQALLLWLGFSALGVAAGGRFYPHYFIQLVPPLALLAGPLLAGQGGDRKLWWARGWVGVGALVLPVAHPLATQRNPAETELGIYLRAHSAPEDRLFVWGQAADLYLEARRRPATRYIATFPLTGYIFGSPLSWDPNHDTSDRIVPGAWDSLAKDFAAHPPQYVVDKDAARPVPKYPMARFPFLRDLVAREYHLIRKLPAGWIYARQADSFPGTR